MNNNKIHEFLYIITCYIRPDLRLRPSANFDTTDNRYVRYIYSIDISIMFDYISLNFLSNVF